MPLPAIVWKWGQRRDGRKGVARFKNGSAKSELSFAQQQAGGRVSQLAGGGSKANGQATARLIENGWMM